MSTRPQSPDRATTHALRLLTLLGSLLLTACDALPRLPFQSGGDATVVYALGSRQGFTSPLNASLRPAIPALEFTGSRIALTSEHQQAISQLAAAWEKDHKIRYLIAGYAPPGLPEDQARSLSDRRALGVRQHLIELGVEASHVQALGLGNDFASTRPASHVVVIYKQ